MNLQDIILISLVVVGLIAVVLYFLNRKAFQKMSEAQAIIDRSRTTSTIFVIDKKKDRPENVNLPKVVIEQLPKWQKMRKMYFVKAKIGPQVSTLMCDKQVFNQLPLKKNIKVDLAGIYIVSIKGNNKKEVAAKPTMWEKAKQFVTGSDKS